VAQFKQLQEITGKENVSAEDLMDMLKPAAVEVPA
jgi:hypothetical protein